MDTVKTDTATDAIWHTVADYLAADGLELDDLELRGSGGGRVLRVVVDAEGGVNLDRLSEVSRGLSRLLDPLPDLQASYRLEVTSPGVERSLRRPQHFEKSLGREVVVKTSLPISGSTSHHGLLVAATEDGCVVEVDGVARTLPYQTVASARTVFRWEPAPPPGSRRTRKVSR